MGLGNQHGLVNRASLLLLFRMAFLLFGSDVT